MNPMIEMIIYSVIPIIFLPIVFFILYLTRSKVVQNKADKHHDE